MFQWIFTMDFHTCFEFWKIAIPIACNTIEFWRWERQFQLRNRDPGRSGIVNVPRTGSCKLDRRSG
ncbi:hypothetical protein Hanom_Chr08g00717591 [Helianthus anomalus]